MNVLDEQILPTERERLRAWGIHVRQIGHDFGRAGMLDQEILVWLHELQAPTLFARDRGFYDRRFAHADYCLVQLEVGKYEVATFVRRFLRHSAFSTERARLGSVARVHPTGIHLWKLHGAGEVSVPWPQSVRE